MFQAAFQGIKETASFYRGCPIKELGFFGRQAPRRLGGVAAGKAAKAALAGTAATDSYQATFVWRIEHFMRLKDLLKKRKITGLCVKSRRFSVGGCTCRLIVYPRGPPLTFPLHLAPGIVSMIGAVFLVHSINGMLHCLVLPPRQSP